ncbi:MAG: alpha/beta fold hydrolase [Candidatus Kariarchaeaceae archaeon]|jgi:pimeloyl-ACP methyl ester carboxylesterase
MPFVSNQGIKIFYQVTGNGPPLVLLHGGFLSHKSFIDFGYITELKDKLQLILIDIRGFGSSDKPSNAENYSFKILIEDIITVLDDLKIESCHVYGHSLGGWLTFGLAKYYPQRLKSIINCDGVPGPNDSNVVQNIAENLDEIISQSTMLPRLKDRFLSNDKLALKVFAGWLANDLPSIIKEIDEIINEVNLPTLLLMSNFEKDSKEYALMLKSANVIPGVKFIHFEDLGHLDIFTESERILPYIKEFLSST